MLKEEADINFPLPSGGWKRHEAIKGGESVIQLRSRAEIVISRILTKIEMDLELKRICIVSHGVMISMLFRSFLNLPNDTSVFLPTGDTCTYLEIR